MQREISHKVFLGNTVSPYDDIGKSSAIARTASNYNDGKEKVNKLQNWSVREDMTRTLSNTHLVSLSLNSGNPWRYRH